MSGLDKFSDYEMFNLDNFTVPKKMVDICFPCFSTIIVLCLIVVNQTKTRAKMDGQALILLIKQSEQW